MKSSDRQASDSTLFPGKATRQERCTRKLTCCVSKNILPHSRRSLWQCRKTGRAWNGRGATCFTLSCPTFKLQLRVSNSVFHFCVLLCLTSDQSKLLNFRFQIMTNQKRVRLLRSPGGENFYLKYEKLKCQTGGVTDQLGWKKGILWGRERRWGSS